MGTKTISITDEAYKLLKYAKSEDESFSQIIVKRFRRHSLLELEGVLSNKQAKELREHVKSRRTTSMKRMDKIARLVK